ncbi:TetR/AcrR family transcriptional regulator [Chelatococcus reniformis]|uniref:TetR family transcriptional regulator n=1 Tax=Chelatococcus reniformis TaxID=1494448 RepID=A0A916UMH2_9HYPH|nr:TetR/AcrR family transcriptional regulator [Chelatococcus reniformis]GGC77552.1 TetR family transcriptional regulator [Chelatococcus reniformis]
MHPAFDRSEEYQRRRLAMVQTAVYLFNRAGFHATSIAEIVRELGVSKAALYYYFADKTDLLFNCYLHAVDNGRHLAESAAAHGGTGLEKLETYIRNQFDALVRKEGAAWILSDLSVLSVEQREEVKKRSRIVDGLVRAFIQEGIDDGSISAIDPKITEFFLMGSLNWLPRWYKPELGYTAAELTDIFLRFAFDGLRPRPGGG